MSSRHQQWTRCEDSTRSRFNSWWGHQFMSIHVRCDGWQTRAICGGSITGLRDAVDYVNFQSASCHACLETMIRHGEDAVARIIELDKSADYKSGVESGARSSRESGSVMKLQEAGSSPVERSKDLVLVHADGGDCHGTILLLGPDGSRCPSCGISPDMQSTEFWPRSKVKT